MSDDYFNDTLNVAPDGSWIFVVVSDSKSSGPRQPVANWIPRTSLAIYGSVLSLCAVILNAILIILVTQGSLRWSRLQRLFTINFCVVQQVVALLVIPANVVKEFVGSWVFGRHACVAWLLIQVLMIAETMWSAVILTTECLLHRVAPDRTISLSSRASRAVVNSALAASWLMSSAAVIPLGITLSLATDGDTVLQDVCAVSLKAEDVVAQSLMAFLFPASIIVTGSVVIVATKLFDKDEGKKKQTETTKIDCTVERNGTRSKSAAAVTAVGVVCVSAWSPFFVVYTILPFCGDKLCVDPAAWTLFAWMGYSSVLLAPAFWYLNPDVRFQSLNTVFKPCHRFYRRRMTQTGKRMAFAPAAIKTETEAEEKSGLINVSKYQLSEQVLKSAGNVESFADVV